MSLVDDYYIRLPDDDETADVISLILANYPYQEVIMRTHLSKIMSRKIICVEADIGKMLKNLLEKNLAFVAVHEKTEEIVGAVILLSGKFAIWQNFITEEFDENLTAVAKIFDEMREQMYSLEDLGTNSAQFAFLTVHQKHRGKKLAKRLLIRSIEHLKLLEVDLIYGIFTSPRSKSVARSSGLISMMDIELSMHNTESDEDVSVDSDMVQISIMKYVLGL